jgi:hypothetical protein
MEDSHISEVDFDQDCSIFGVFDGHGGANFFLLTTYNQLMQTKHS